MPITWEPLAARFGARVFGLELDREISDEDAQDLKDLWLTRGVLLFRGRKTTAAAHLALSRIFGTLEVHPAHEGWVEGHPELTTIEYVPENRANTSIYEVDGVELARRPMRAACTAPPSKAITA
jgi:taurine dioxygenase